MKYTVKVKYMTLMTRIYVSKRFTLSESQEAW